MARPGLGLHPKFRRLCHLLGEPKPHVRGYLELLWEVAYENGDPVIGDAVDVELAADYPGEPGKFSKALLECGGDGRAGFIEANDAGQLQVHDLYDHCPEYVQSRAQREQERKLPKKCAQCLAEYHSSDHRSKFCTSSCRTAHWREKEAERDGVKRTVTEKSVTVTDCDGTPAPAPAPAPAPPIHEKKNPPLSPQGVNGRKSSKSKKKELPQIPEKLDTPEFCAAWSDWIEYRKERKPRVTPLSAKKAFDEKLLPIGPKRAVTAINHSIASGYQGIFEPNSNSKPTGASGAQQRANDIPDTEETRRQSARYQRQ